ncbi:LamG domain-containing protein [Aureispira sp. CCB-QB1]|uniref:LamG domain-containing protein n=1 Tax=Aureispira sp. CCB-QB1 TaxID=1313421 RepID=UPI0006974DCB|nr:LamG domain-containing protein [Aureispira sp. CCB-QB1]
MKNSLLLVFWLLFLIPPFLSAQISKKGLVAHYLFNADAKDASGNNNNGLISGGVFPTKDRFNNDCGAMKFNGSDGYIHVPHSKSLSSPQSEYTIALWFKALDGSEYSDLQWMTICCKSNIRDETSTSPQFRLQSTRYTVSMNTDFTENFDHKIEFNKWYHYAVTYDGDYCRVYLNNKEIVNWAYKTEFSPNQLAMEIGRDLPGIIEYFCGVMDELVIYDRALSQREITSLYNNQSEKTSKKPCGFSPPITIPKKNLNPKKENSSNVITQSLTSNSSNNEPCSSHPTFVNEDTIEYQQIVVVDNPNIKLLFYDAEKEDGDIVSINFNGAWVLERYHLKRKSTQKPKQLNLSLIPNFENYIFTKAWNLGSIPPNTLTIEIIDSNSNKPPRIVNIKSDIGRSGAIKLIYKP